MDKEGEACVYCACSLKYITSPFCMVCGRQLDDEMRETCSDCGRRRHSFVRGVAAFAYTKEIKQSMYRFKYDNQREYAVFYADTLFRLRGHIIAGWRPDVIIPVPLHEKRYRKRGYNQAALIAYRLGRRLGIPVDDKVLFRIKNTVPQKELNDKERAKNIKNAFQVGRDIVKYRKVLLIDDIYTTGATLDCCAEALRAAGAGKIYFAAVCAGRGF